MQRKPSGIQAFGLTTSLAKTITGPSPLIYRFVVEVLPKEGQPIEQKSLLENGVVDASGWEVPFSETWYKATCRS
jgi:hypothetical protein